MLNSVCAVGIFHFDFCVKLLLHLFVNGFLGVIAYFAHILILISCVFMIYLKCSSDENVFKFV